MPNGLPPLLLKSTWFSSLTELTDKQKRGTNTIPQVRILKSMMSLVTTIKIVAALDETPGVGRNLLRRTKAICNGIAKLMAALEAPGGSAPVICAQILEAVGNLDEVCKVCLEAFVTQPIAL